MAKQKVLSKALNPPRLTDRERKDLSPFAALPVRPRQEATGPTQERKGQKQHDTDGKAEKRKNYKPSQNSKQEKGTTIRHVKWLKSA